MDLTPAFTPEQKAQAIRAIATASKCSLVVGNRLGDDGTIESIVLVRDDDNGNTAPLYPQDNG